MTSTRKSHMKRWKVLKTQNEELKGNIDRDNFVEMSEIAYEF